LPAEDIGLAVFGALGPVLRSRALFGVLLENEIGNRTVSYDSVLHRRAHPNFWCYDWRQQKENDQRAASDRG
jgi:hypothetical protein